MPQCCVCRRRRLSVCLFVCLWPTECRPTLAKRCALEQNILLTAYTLTLSLSFYPRDTMLARVIAIATCLSLRLSVCPSVTRRYCVKTKKASGMISSPSVSPKTLVFWRQISSPNSKGFPQNGGLKQGSVGKIRLFSSFKRQYLENGSRYGQSYY